MEPVDNELPHAVDQLLEFRYEFWRSRFPYADVRSLRPESGETWDLLIPKLDYYWSNIAGYATWGERILKLPTDKVGPARLSLENSFFDKWPEYDSLSKQIDAVRTPELSRRFEGYEKLRMILLKIFSSLDTINSANS